MIDSDALLDFLKRKAKRPLKPKEIARELSVPTEDYRALKRILRELEASGAIYRVRRGRFAAPERINLVVGRLQITRRGFGFVILEGGGADVFIRAAHLADAYDGDRVAARIDHPNRRPNPQGSVVRVLVRARTQVVGTFKRSRRYGWVVPEDPKFHRNVFIAPGEKGEARAGDIVVARIVDWGAGERDPVGEIVEVLGPRDRAGVDILTIIHSHELPLGFADGVVREAEEASQRSRDEALEGRANYTDLLTFTIDPSDAKDHDDALSIERIDKGRWRVGVHIADVSHFVRSGTALDAEARERGTSVYLVDRVIPMLPEVLSGEVCSLKPGEDRFALSLILDVDADGRVHATRLEQSVIRSLYGLTYEQAQSIIDGEGEWRPDLVGALQELNELATAVRRRRLARGGLDFDLPEARVILNSAGEATRVEEVLRLDSHRLIEEFMILANETVAGWADTQELPFIYRIHEPPDPTKIEGVFDSVAELGVRTPRKSERSGKALQRILEAVESRPGGALVSTLVLRSLKQARYADHNRGHFGLGSEAYTHFTSPIRRYPDLVVHRLLRKSILEGAPIRSETSDSLAATAELASTRERQAMDAERDSVELKKLEYLEDRIDERFSGTISGVTAYGLFVLLDQVLVEGLLHVSGLNDDYYHYQEEKHALVGESGGRVFRLGDRIDVRILAVDRPARQLDVAPA